MEFSQFIQTLINDILVEFQLFFSDLNWLYVFLYSILIYGINHKEEFAWYNAIFEKIQKFKSLKIWIAGMLLMVICCIFHYLEADNVIEPEYISQILRSWLVVIVFNSILTKEIKKIDK